MKTITLSGHLVVNDESITFADIVKALSALGSSSLESKGEFLKSSAEGLLNKVWVKVPYDDEDYLAVAEEGYWVGRTLFGEKLKEMREKGVVIALHCEYHEATRHRFPKIVSDLDSAAVMATKHGFRVDIELMSMSEKYRGGDDVEGVWLKVAY